jgi:acyl-CoA hydrolase
MNNGTDNLEEVINSIIDNVGMEITVGTPLGAGKPNHLLNALYQKAKVNKELKLTILTALTLQRPGGKSLLEQRFFGPLNERIFDNYPELDYAKDRDTNDIPENIRIIEFYYPPGKLLHNKHAQKNYLSTNYTHAVRDILNKEINVLCQQVSEGEINGEKVFSLSCNTDITLDIINGAKERAMPLYVVGQVNQDLPFMYGESIVTPEIFDIILDNRELYYKVFGPPKMSVSPTDYMIGLHTSTLVKDDGEIQIGIGSLGDALVYALCMRQENNSLYQEYRHQFDITDGVFPVLKEFGDFSVFEKGLFAATEMFVDSFEFLFRSKILKKKVYDHVVLQRLLNTGEIQEEFDEEILHHLLREKAISSTLNEEDFKFLQNFGVFKSDFEWTKNSIKSPQGELIKPDLINNMRQLQDQCLGNILRNGAVSHAGFFLGPQSFYNFLKGLPIGERKLIRMKQVSNINHLYGHEKIDCLQRKNGRFINNCMKVTLNGSACSDALENGRQVSGVGGQYNFVAMAHELPDARSILQLKSTRVDSRGKIESNIVFQYGNCTIPRHLRDIVVTEYGIADLRGKTDEEVAIELIQISDSRFQNELILVAKKNGKISETFKLSSRFTSNFPERYLVPLKKAQLKDLFMPFPFGTDLTDQEITIGRALKYIKAKKGRKILFLKFLLKSLLLKRDKRKYEVFLNRLNLLDVKTLSEKVYQKIILNAIAESS